MDVVDAMAWRGDHQGRGRQRYLETHEDAAITIEKVTITTYPGPAAGDEATSDSSVG